MSKNPGKEQIRLQKTIIVLTSDHFSSKQIPLNLFPVVPAVNIYSLFSMILNKPVIMTIISTLVHASLGKKQQTLFATFDEKCPCDVSEKEMYLQLEEGISV